MPEPRSIILNVPWIPPKEVRGNYKGHWALKRKKNLLLKASGQDQALISGERFERMRLTFTWFKAGVGDIDNFSIGMKGFVDGLILGNMCEDDDSEHVSFGTHRFVRVKRVDERTEILVEAIS